MPRILILGGTTEAATLAKACSAWPDLDVITSLAGRTRLPDPVMGTIRKGGFGGPEGLACYLRDQSIETLIDATHPFAEQISRHAVVGAERAKIPHLRLVRHPWEKRPGDHWIQVPDAAGAARVLPSLANRVFLTTGHRDLAAFEALDDLWFLIRTIEPVIGLLPRNAECIEARGPFDQAAEIALLRRYRIDVLVTKASGGSATYAKIAAARELHLPVVMIQRPPPPSGPVVHDIDAALAWLRHVLQQPAGVDRQKIR